MPQTYPTYEELHELLADPAIAGRVVELAARPEGLAELNRMVADRRAEADSYGVSCTTCGKWETVCTCEVNA